MNKFSAKSFLYLPLMALSIGIIPVLLLPPGQMLLSMHEPLEPVRVLSNAMFPIRFNAYALIWIEFALLLPFAWMLWALATAKKPTMDCMPCL